MRSYERYIAVETAIGMGINGAISAAVFRLLFGGEALIARADAVIDTLPQTFMVALMSALVPSLLARRRLAPGSSTVRLRQGRPFLPTGLTLRCVALALAVTVVIGAATTLSLTAVLPDLVPGAPLLAFKIVYGALVAAIVTPLALCTMLADGPPASARAKEH